MASDNATVFGYILNSAARWLSVKFANSSLVNFGPPSPVMFTFCANKQCAVFTDGSVMTFAWQSRTYPSYRLTLTEACFVANKKRQENNYFNVYSAVCNHSSAVSTVPSPCPPACFNDVERMLLEGFKGRATWLIGQTLRRVIECKCLSVSLFLVIVKNFVVPNLKTSNYVQALGPWRQPLGSVMKGSNTTCVLTATWWSTYEA